MPITYNILSGSTSGRNIKVAATATAGTLIHTAVAGASSIDEIYLWATNTSGNGVKLTIERGGVTDPDDLDERLVPSEDGWLLVLPGAPLNGGLVVRAFAATADVINIMGHVLSKT